MSDYFDTDRNIIRCTCDTCGTNLSVWYDKDFDEYICKECLYEEQLKEENEEEE